MLVLLRVGKQAAALGTPLASDCNTPGEMLHLAETCGRLLNPCERALLSKTVYVWGDIDFSAANAST
jgi:hypothetical protein